MPQQGSARGTAAPCGTVTGAGAGTGTGGESFVSVCGRRVQFSDVTPHLLDCMTDAEREQYARVGESFFDELL